MHRLANQRNDDTPPKKKTYQSTLARDNSSDEEIRGRNDRPEPNIEGTIPWRGKGIQIGQFAELHRSYGQDEVAAFGALIGDFNPVHFPMVANSNNHHYDADDDQQHVVVAPDGEKPIVHGILLSSAFSTIFATLVPGCIYRSQSLEFRHPVLVAENFCGRVTVTKLRQINRRGGSSGVLCTCDTSITKSDEDGGMDGVICISGEARVWLPGATVAVDST